MEEHCLRKSFTPYVIFLFIIIQKKHSKAIVSDFVILISILKRFQ
jgi:hypothetical protein